MTWLIVFVELVGRRLVLFVGCFLTQARIGADRGQQAQAGRVRGRQAEDGLHRDRSQPQPPPQGHDFVGNRFIAWRVQLQGQVKIVRINARQLLSVMLRRARRARAQEALDPPLLPAAQANQPRALRGQRVQVKPARSQCLPLRAALDQR